MMQTPQPVVPLGQVIEDVDLMRDMIDQGYIRAKKHPGNDYWIYNYSEKAQYENVWNEATRKCRGLILDSKFGLVVARPFEKFFNHNQDQATDIGDTPGQVLVTDKADGSLGILYPLPDGGHAIATRGSFISDQAVHATKLYNELYADTFEPYAGVTCLFEIVYPDNRIVLDYNGMDDLIWLGAIENATGRPVQAGLTSWVGPTIQSFPYASFTEALAAPPRPNAEGMVVYFCDTNQRVKIKQDDYVALHRIVTGCTARTIWYHVAINWQLEKGCPLRTIEQDLRVGPETIARVTAAGRDWLAKFKESTPDEFYEWVDNTVDQLNKSFSQLKGQIIEERETIAQSLGANAGDRRAFAELVIPNRHKSAFFMLLDGRDIDGYIFRILYPEHETPFKQISEDVA